MRMKKMDNNVKELVDSISAKSSFDIEKKFNQIMSEKSTQVLAQYKENEFKPEFKS